LEQKSKAIAFERYTKKGLHHQTQKQV